MKPIRILDKNFNLLGEIDDYESLIFIRRFFKVGEFELRINVNKSHTEKLIENNLIVLGDSLNKVGIIMHRENTYDEMGEPTDTLLIKGPTLKGLCNRRLIVPPVNKAYESCEGSQEAIMKYFVDRNMVNPDDLGRKIENVIIAENLDRGQQDKWRSRFEVLADKLTEIGEYSNLGWDIILDYENQKFVFDVLEGRDLTADQEILPPVIFSIEFNNITNRYFVESILNHSNVGYAGGQGEKEDRLIQQIGDITGFERIETFLDCSNAEDVTELLVEGNRRLKELDKIINFEVNILPYGSFNYEKDYDLGDIVTIQDRKLNLILNTRIIEFKEIYESDGFKLEAVFGSNIPTIIDKLKSKQVVR